MQEQNTLIIIKAIKNKHRTLWKNEHKVQKLNGKTRPRLVTIKITKDIFNTIDIITGITSSQTERSSTKIISTN